jgi:hypothetical protein
LHERGSSTTPRVSPFRQEFQATASNLPSSESRGLTSKGEIEVDKAILTQETYGLPAARPAAWRTGATYLVAVVVGMIIALAGSAAINSRSTTTSAVAGPSSIDPSVAALIRSERAEAAPAVSANQSVASFLRSEHADAAVTLTHDQSVASFLRSEHADAAVSLTHDQSVSAFLRSEHADAAVTLTHDQSVASFLRSEHADAAPVPASANDRSVADFMRSERAETPVTTQYPGPGR